MILEIYIIITCFFCVASVIFEYGREGSTVLSIIASAIINIIAWPIVLLLGCIAAYKVNMK